MASNPGELAGSLYNLLRKQGVKVCRVRYSGDGCWQVCIQARGGLIRGVPVVAYDGPSRRVTVATRSLFGRRRATAFHIGAPGHDQEVLDRVIALVRDRLPPRYGRETTAQGQRYSAPPWINTAQFDPALKGQESR